MAEWRLSGREERVTGDDQTVKRISSFLFLYLQVELLGLWTRASLSLL